MFSLILKINIVALHDTVILLKDTKDLKRHIFERRKKKSLFQFKFAFTL